jgi:hypothetical protein
MVTKFIKSIAFAVVMMTAFNASAECLISLNLCKPLAIRKPTNFYDSDALANTLPNRCLQRAREYLNWCNTKDSVAGAYFYSKGNYTIGVVVTPTSSALYGASVNGVNTALKDIASPY